MTGPMLDTQSQRDIDRADGLVVDAELVKILEDEDEAVIEDTKSGVEAILKSLGPEKQLELLDFLEGRFKKLKDVLGLNNDWEEIQSSLINSPNKMWSIYQLEMSGGQPAFVEMRGEFLIFADVSSESPIERRGFAFNKLGRDMMEKIAPNEKYNGIATETAKEWGAGLMRKRLYTKLQRVLNLDRTSRSYLNSAEVKPGEQTAFIGNKDGNKMMIQPGGVMVDKDRGFRCEVTVSKAAKAEIS